MCRCVWNGGWFPRWLFDPVIANWLVLCVADQRGFHSVFIVNASDSSPCDGIIELTDAKWSFVAHRSRESTKIDGRCLLLWAFRHTRNKYIIVSLYSIHHCITVLNTSLYHCTQYIIVSLYSIHHCITVLNTSLYHCTQYIIVSLYSIHHCITVLNTSLYHCTQYIIVSLYSIHHCITVLNTSLYHCTQYIIVSLYSIHHCITVLNTSLYHCTRPTLKEKHLYVLLFQNNSPTSTCWFH